jgi:hypothetical protein
VEDDGLFREADGEGRIFDFDWPGLHQPLTLLGLFCRGHHQTVPDGWRLLLQRVDERHLAGFVAVERELDAFYCGVRHMEGASLQGIDISAARRLFEAHDLATLLVIHGEVVERMLPPPETASEFRFW